MRPAPSFKRSPQELAEAWKKVAKEQPRTKLEVSTTCDLLIDLRLLSCFKGTMLSKAVMTICKELLFLDNQSRSKCSLVPIKGPH
jgi:hypothetical protein